MKVRLRSTKHLTKKMWRFMNRPSWFATVERLPVTMPTVPAWQPLDVEVEVPGDTHLVTIGAGVIARYPQDALREMIHVA